MSLTVNLYSDTQTRPTPAMRDAMARAPVGDEQRGQDPTVNHLCDRVADLLGMEQALFLPSGAMCNLIAVKTHTNPGDAILCERDCHIIRAECGGPGVASGVIVDPIDTPDGTFDGRQVEERVGFLRLGLYAPPPTLLCVENTHNFAGGTVWPVQKLREVTTRARDQGLATHLDGARLLNAAVAGRLEPAELCQGFDSAWIDFSKGLGAPVGAALAGSKAFIERARRYKHLFGGAMRQAGIIAAGAVHALDHHINRLADDHANARRLALGLSALPGVRLIRRPETNIVFFEVPDAGRFVAKMADKGIELSLLHGRVRAVTHLDVDSDAIEHAIAKAAEVLGELQVG
jgi:threonine aldolase